MKTKLSNRNYRIKELFYWKNLAEYPLPLYSNIIGVIVRVTSYTSDINILTYKLLLMQPGNAFITLLIQCKDRESGINVDKIIFINYFFKNRVRCVKVKSYMSVDVLTLTIQ